MPFRDYFSDYAQAYAMYRPDYPAGLFAYLAGLAPDRELAWDCATGSGQAANTLADYFTQVFATDASKQLIKLAKPRANITYRVMPAEQTDFIDSSISLITVATALHWFDFDSFYFQVNRVLKPNGIIAAWAYSTHHIDVAVDAITTELVQYINVGAKQDERSTLFMGGYKALPFPFQKIAAPDFQIEKQYNLHQLMSYLGTWSRVNNYMKQTGENLLEKFFTRFLDAWGNPEQLRTVHWPLHLLVGRK